MVWRRKGSDSGASAGYMPVSDGGDGEKMKTPKGYVPMVVGSEGRGGDRVLVHVRLLKEPCMVALLETAAQELGYSQHGVLRIPCDMRRFRRVVDGALREAR